MKKYIAQHNKKEIPFEIESKEGSLTVKSENGSWDLNLTKSGPNHYSVLHEGKSYDLRFFHEEGQSYAFFRGERIAFALEDARTAARKAKAGAGGAAGGAIQGPAEIRAMMPGKIAAVKVKKGDTVTEGQGVVVLEAMKMENEMAAPKAGTVTDVRVTAGQSVESGAVMVVIE